MTLTVNRSIVHQVYQDPQGEFGLRFSPEMLSDAAEVETLLTELTAVYQAKPGKGYASFVSADDPVYAAARAANETIPEPEFPQSFQQWLANEVDFVGFSQAVAKLLQSELSRYSFAEPGFLLLADYEQNSDRMLLVSFLPVRDGVMVQPDLSVHKSAQLDVAKIQLAARINITEYEADQALYYISFIKGRTGRKTAEFFLDFLGCAERINAKASTQQLVATVQAYVQEADLAGEEAQQVRKSVYEYCGEQWQQGEQVELNTLDERLQAQGAPSFHAFTQNHDVALPASFPADKASLRSLVKFQGQGGGLSVAFDQAMLGARVNYDVQNDTLTIIGTPPNLRDQLRRFFGAND